MTPPLSPERLTRLLDEAVRPVTARPGTFDRIRHGARRRRTARRAGIVMLAAALIAGGTLTALMVTPGGSPARISSLASSAAKAAPAGGQTRTAAVPSAVRPVPSAPQPAPSPPQPASSAVRSAPPSFARSAPSPAGGSAPASARLSALPSTSGPAAAVIPSAVGTGTWPIDGFGRPAAAVTIVPVGNAKTTVSFLLVVRSARYGTQAVPFYATSARDMPPYGPVIVGAADAAKDGHTELFVLVDAGCCTEFWTIFRLVSGRVVQMAVQGAPARLGVGGSVMDNGGFSCDGPYLVTYWYAAQPVSGTRVTFLAYRDTLRWAGSTLVIVSVRQATIRGVQNPGLANYSGVSCGGLPQYEFTR